LEESVSYRLSDEGVCFGGQTLTTTDFAYFIKPSLENLFKKKETASSSNSSSNTTIKSLDLDRARFIAYFK
jgi:hypothetical protein